jgi:outer membrane lipoprotein-sorting protein
MIGDGQFLWIYYPTFSEVEKYTLSAAGPAAEAVAGMTSGLTLQGLQEQFRVQVFASNDGKVLVLVPKSGRLRRVMRELVIDIGSNQQARRIEWTSAKNEVTTLELSGERSIARDGDLFRFRPPEGTRVVTPLGS